MLSCHTPSYALSISTPWRRPPHHPPHHPAGHAGHHRGIYRGSQHPGEVVPRQVRHSLQLPPHHARPCGGRRLSHAQGGGDGPRLDVTERNLSPS